ncbi:MAG: hypothetical protein M0026_16820 [Nocardiopsaceae bacterium]|nr:hypothetical protein [Nocardiopsaceae bacterium]
MNTTTPASAVDVNVGHGPAVAFAGLRRTLSCLREAGADLDDLAQRHSAEWAVLFPDEDEDAPHLAAIALTPSERRLHRESEQIFRVLCVAAAAICQGARLLDRPIALHGMAGTDLPSLRGFMRAVEYAGTMPGVRLEIASPGPGRPALTPAADHTRERALALARMGLAIAPTSGALPPAPVPDPDTREGVLFATAATTQARCVDRLAAAVAYCRAAFFSTNWEGMAAVAETALPLTRDLADRDAAAVLTPAGRDDGQADAIEIEPAVLRSGDDVRALLHKILGIQAGFRGRREEAMKRFAAMRGDAPRLSAELRAQSHLYTALTLAEQPRHADAAVAEIDRGFAAVPPRPGEPVSTCRERGWLHNLRAQVHVMRSEFRPALDQVKQALACVADTTDAGSAHLRATLLANLSVLQEKAGRLEQALRTWNRFLTAACAGNAGFRKHHSYRAAGLHLASGDRASALEDLDRTLASAAETNDVFHTCEVRVETGALLARGGDTDGAEEQFRLAGAAAAALGDPYRMALAAAGGRVCVGQRADKEVTELLGCSLTRRAERDRLAAELGADPQTVLTRLPRPATRLNRPFDLIDLWS